MRTFALLSLIALLCTCTGDLPAVDASVSSDGRPSVDASAGPDSSGGGPDARAAVTIDVVCQPYTRTITSANGARQVTTSRYGIVDSVGPDDDYMVEQCGAHSTPAFTCPAGSTCTGSVDPPGITGCSRAYRSGSFSDGKLLVYCGQIFETFAADGTLTGSGSFGYTSMRVIAY